MKNRFRHSPLFLLTVLLMGVGFSLLWAQVGAEQAVILDNFLGKVMVLPRGAADLEPATDGKVLSEGSTVTTGEDSSALIRLEKAGTITLGEQSQLEIDKAKLQGEITDVQLRLALGTLFGNIEKEDSASRIQIATPTAVTGVRGTQFLVQVINGITSIFCHTGELSVENMGGEAYTVETGQAVSVSPTGVVAGIPEGSAELAELMAAFVAMTEQSETLAADIEASDQILSTATTAAPVVSVDEPRTTASQ